MSPRMSRLHRHDERLLHYVVGCRRAGLDRVMTLATRLGDPAVVVGITLLLLAVRETRSAGVSAAFAVTLSHLAVQALKRTVNRPRPALPSGIECILHAPDRFSFPSGHAAASISLALGVSTFLTPGFAVVFLLTAVVTGTSRCYLGVHYPGDVAAGCFLGWLAWWIGQVLGVVPIA